MQETTQKNLANIEKALQPFIGQIQSLTVTDEATKINAIEFLGQIKIRAKRVTVLLAEELAPIKKKMDPLKAEAKEIDNSYKIWLAKLGDAATILNKGIVKYLEMEERKAALEAERIRKEQLEKQRAEEKRLAAIRAEEERLRAEAAKAKTAEEKANLQWEADNKQDEIIKAEDEQALIEVPVVQAPERTVRAHAGVFSLKKVWTWEVENETLLRKEHPELFMLNEKAIDQLVRQGDRNIAGLRIFQASQGAMRV